MAQAHRSPASVRTGEAPTVLFYLVDGAFRTLDPKGGRYESLERLSDSEVLALALFQQLWALKSGRSFPR
ncbi:MAG: hypothetical protein M3R38_08995 [Actinomycetota bacterium]|nr:hypothetical protein [Actinomycetota bacterium]